MAPLKVPPLANSEYQVGWICALPLEMTAARAMLDEIHEQPQEQDSSDQNNYCLGRIQRHNVVIACLPDYGISSAAVVAEQMLHTFKEIRFGLMVGIGGGVPSVQNDIRLGDVVVSRPEGTFGGVVQYEFGKAVKEGHFERTGSLDRPPWTLLTALRTLEATHDMEDNKIPSFLSEMSTNYPKMRIKFIYPGAENDQLFREDYEHPDMSPNCDACESAQLIHRQARESDAPHVHYGLIASGSQVIKHGLTRSKYGKQLGVLCFEMEAAGLMNHFKCLVIRGICDYSDSHKNKRWQPYAAATAAAYAKELLLVTPADKLKMEKPIVQVTDLELQEIGNKIFTATTEQYKDDRHRRCHQVFRTSKYESYKDRNPDRVEGTCQWVVNHSHYRSWFTSTRDNLLWISADPGCGKSVLSKSLLDKELHSHESRSTCYFFFKDNEVQNSLSTALCALLHQIFSYRPHLVHHAIPYWDEDGEKLQKQTAQLWQILLSAAMDPTAGDVVCILDALDECGRDEQVTLIGFLVKFYNSATAESSRSSTLKFLVTSRPYDSVQRWFEETTSRLPQVRLRGEDKNDQIHEEINLVMDLQIDRLAAEFMLSENHQERLRQSLRQMEHRTYLWLYLAMEDIRTTYRDSLDPEEEPTNTLPTSVESAYERILQRITEKQKSQARKILLIIVGARRPLTISEMSLALNAASAHELGQSYMKEPNVQHLERHVRQWCGLFVFINHSQLFLIHQTAKEFLVAQSTNFSFVSGRWKSTFSQTEIEGEMARLCVAYLCLRQQDRRPIDEDGQGYQRANTKVAVIQSSTWEEQNKFFEYCAEHWTSHLREDVVTKDRKVLDRVLLLYATDTDQFHAWFPIMWKAFYPYESTAKVQIQHVVSMSDHAFVLEEIFHRAIFKLEARDSTGRRALHWAAERGHEKVVEMLLAKGAKVNAQGGHYGHALQAASLRGHEKVVEILLAKGAKVNAQGGHFGHALQAASWGGHEKVVEMLLAKGAEVDAQGGKYEGNALLGASWGGHEKVVEMLLAKGAKVDAQGGKYEGNALLGASWGGHEKVVEMLLAKGAKVNAQGGKYGNALQAASERGHEKVVEMMKQQAALTTLRIL